MRLRLTRKTPRALNLRLCLEFLEDRRVLSGMSHAHPSSHANDHATMVGPVQYYGSHEQFQTVVHSSHDYSAGANGQSEGTRSQPSARQDQAGVSKADHGQHTARADETTDHNDARGTSDNGKHGHYTAPAGQNDAQQSAPATDATDHNNNDEHGASTAKHGNHSTSATPHDESAAPAHDTDPEQSSHHHRVSDDGDAGQASTTSAPHGQAHADRAFDHSDEATTARQTDETTTVTRVPATQQASSSEEGHTATEEATAARTYATHAIATASTVRTASLAAQHEAATQAAVWHTAATFVDKALADESQENQAHDQHAVAADRARSSLTAPAREEAQELAATAALLQANANFAVHPEAGVEHHAGVLNTLFLALAEARGDFFSWNSSWTIADLTARDAGSHGPAYGSESGASAVQPAVSLSEVPVTPEASALAAGGLAADTAALEEAVRQFLNGLHTAGRELTRVLADNDWARWVVVATLAALAAEVGRRRLRQRFRGVTADEEAEEATLSWLSGSYPFRPDAL